MITPIKRWTSKDIKNLRMKYNLSQSALADIIGVATNYVYLMEKGVRKPSKPLSLLLDCVEEKLKKKGGERKHGKRNL